MSVLNADDDTYRTATTGPTTSTGSRSGGVV